MFYTNWGKPSIPVTKVKHPLTDEVYKLTEVRESSYSPDGYWYHLESQRTGKRIMVCLSAYDQYISL